MEYESSTTLDAPDRASEAFEMALSATNRLLHAAAFAWGNQKVLPLLRPEDLEEVQCQEVDGGGTERVLDIDDLILKRPVRLNATPNAENDLQAVLASPPPVLSPAFHLWSEAVESHYAGHYRETIVVARAATEVAWQLAAEAVADRLAASTSPPHHPELFTHYVDRAMEDRVALKDRFDRFSKALFGFSFRDDWEEAEWGRLNNFFELRNRVTHGTTQPRPDDAWQAIRVTRKALTKLAELHDDVIGRPGPPGTPSPHH